MHSSMLLRAGALAVLASGLSAQTLLPPGTAVPYTAGDDDEGYVDVTLPFMFTFPDGTMTADIQVVSNGHILPGGSLLPGAGLYRFGENLFDLETGPTGIYAYWDDLVGSVPDNIFVDTTSTPGLAVITWQDVSEFLGPGPATCQAQLSSTGEVTIVWDDRFPVLNGDCIVGLAEGAGPAPEVDFSDVNLLGSITGGATVYEFFDDPVSDSFDLNDGTGTTGLIFTPAPGGYVVTGTVPPPPLPPAEFNLGRIACEGQTALTITPDGLGGYIVTDGGTFDAGFAAGTSFALTDESTSGAQMLSFNFPFVGGPTTNMIDITSNGRILEAGTGETSSFTISLTDFTDDPVAQIAPLWTDLNPADSDSTGDIWLHDTGTFASVTYDGIAEFFGSVPLSFQAKLFPDGSVEFIYDFLDLGSTDAAIIGISPGGLAGVDPDGASDLSTAGMAPIVSTDGLVYEFFDFGTPPFDFDTVLANDSVEIVAVTPPAIGGPAFECDVVDATGTATNVFYYLGFPVDLLAPTPPVDLGLIGLPECAIYVDLFGITGFGFAQATGVPGTPTVIGDFTAFPPALAGFDLLRVQAIVINPALPEPIFPTNEYEVVIGV